MIQETNKHLVQLLIDLKGQFGSQRPLTAALSDNTDPGLLLARAARDAAYAEVLDFVEAAVREMTHVPADLTPDIPETPVGPIDLDSYLEAL